MISSSGIPPKAKPFIVTGIGVWALLVLLDSGSGLFSPGFIKAKYFSIFFRCYVMFSFLIGAITMLAVVLWFFKVRYTGIILKWMVLIGFGLFILNWLLNLFGVLI